MVACDGEKKILSTEELRASFKKGLRNGNWRHLNPLDNALYRASLWYAKHRGSIVNAALVGKHMALVEKLKETKGMRIFKRGFKKAAEMLRKCGGARTRSLHMGSSVETLVERPRLYLLAGRCSGEEAENR